VNGYFKKNVQTTSKVAIAF